MASIFNQQHFAIVVGTDDRDQILTWGVQSEVLGREGDDGISGGQRFPGPSGHGQFGGPTFLFGEGGDDTIFLESGGFADGGPGNDFLMASGVDATLSGGQGNDQLVGADDTFVGQPAPRNRIDGGDGDDTLGGGSSTDRAFGGADGDRVFGATAPDRFQELPVPPRPFRCKQVPPPGRLESRITGLEHLVVAGRGLEKEDGKRNRSPQERQIDPGADEQLTAVGAIADQRATGVACLDDLLGFLVADLFTEDVELAQRHTAALCASSRLLSRASLPTRTFRTSSKPPAAFGAASPARGAVHP